MKRRQRRKRQKSIQAAEEGMDAEHLKSSAILNAASSMISSSTASLPPMIKSMMVPFSSSLSASAMSQLWEDVFLSPEAVVPSPFRILKPEEEEALFFAARPEGGSDPSDSVSSSLTSFNLPGELPNNNTIPLSNTSTIHFCFLVHGHRGHSRDLSYVQAVMRRWASLQEASSSQRCVVHSVRCNEKKTDDGVVAGGKRLMEEMVQVIRETCPPRRIESATTLQKVTISLWGNSLGGLYARYALSLLSETCTVQSAAPHCWVLDDTYEIYLNVFCTTATPHLGISGHTFVALPRRAEIGLATAMGETGRDLFRLNSILYDMATQSSYVQPLSLFQKRICYANAYGTDFPVPASTAAFLSELSTVPHYFADDEDDATLDEASLVQIATLYTTPAFHKNSDRDAPIAPRTDATITSSDMELAQMSVSLDSLGWKKVFVDMRKEVPHIVLPKSLIRRSSSNMAANADIKETKTNVTTTTTASSVTSSTESERSSSEEEDDVVAGDQSKIASKSKARPYIEPIHRLKKRFSKSNPDSCSLILSSKDVAAAVSASALLVTPSTTASNDGEKSRSMNSLHAEEEDENNYATIHWPLGHNMIVAFSRSRWSAHMNKAGRPIVDGLAKEIVNDIFAFDTNPKFCDK
jgi:Putative serine esterase (DUF676)